jgi:hypothetical protein
MSVSAMKAVVQVARALIQSVGYHTPRLIVASYSAGQLTAAQFVADPPASMTLLAYVDLEGPSNSFTLQFAPSCFKGLGDGSAVGPPARLLGKVDFQDCYAYSTRFASGFERYSFPFRELARSHVWPDRQRAKAGAATRVEGYWAERDVELALRRRTAPYIRLQGFEDHAQGVSRTEYQNFHAVLALEAARQLGTDAYLVVDPVGSDPKPYKLRKPGTYLDWSKYPNWPAHVGPSKNEARSYALVDAVRYAAVTWG